MFGGAGAATKLGDAGLLVMRVFSGLAMAFGHGLGKVQDPDRAIGSASGLGFPAPTLFGWALILTEFLGGILLALGLLTRPSAFFIGFTMAVAAFMRHGADAFGKKELALMYLAIMLVFVLAGPGRFSLDKLISK